MMYDWKQTQKALAYLRKKGRKYVGDLVASPDGYVASYRCSGCEESEKKHIRKAYPLAAIDFVGVAEVSTEIAKRAATMYATA